MEKWITENWLALYGAIVGTLALVINFFRFIHTIKTDKVKIRISISPHPEKMKNINRLKDSQNKEPWEGSSLAEIYLVTIRNVGTIDAYIEDAGVICTQKNSHSALVSSSTNRCLLNKISEIKIAPKSSKTFKVYLKANQEPFEARKAFAIDSTGKKWLAKAKKQ